MSRNIGENRSWKKTLASWAHPRALTMLFLGFSAGIPLPLIFSTLSVWLREAGVSRSAVTFFSWAALGYSFKFIWAPLIDLLPLPLLTGRLGRRRGWLLVSQLLIISAICWMGLTDPVVSPVSLSIMAMAAVMLGFSSATQDIVIDAYRIECAEQSMQALLASMYIAGYRIGMLAAGAGSLFLASWFGTAREAYRYTAWQGTYLVMATLMLVGVITTLSISEPQTPPERKSRSFTPGQYGRILTLFLLVAGAFVLAFFYSGQISGQLKTAIAERLPLSGILLGFLVEGGRFGLAIGAAALMGFMLVRGNLVDRAMAHEAYIMPVKDFFLRYPLKSALLLLALVGCYRLSDIVLGVVANVFYVDLGFTNTQIATITKTFGLVMTLSGNFLGGLLTVRYGIMRVLFAGALLSAGTNLLFMLLAESGANSSMLAMVIAADNLSAGLAVTAFVAFLSSLTNISFTAVQYAIFSSAMTLFPNLLGGYSGSMVSSLGYGTFFLVTACAGLPVLLLIWLVWREEGLRANRP